MTKPTKWHVRPAKTQISLGIRPVLSESSLPAWRKLGSLATHWAHSEDSDQTGRMPRLIGVFAGCTCHFVGFVTRRLKYIFGDDIKYLINYRTGTEHYRNPRIWISHMSLTTAPDCELRSIDLILHKLLVHVHSHCTTKASEVPTVYWLQEESFHSYLTRHVF